MKIERVINNLNLINYTPSIEIEGNASGVYVGDLLSHVMANCNEGNIWVTILTNINVVAVANLSEAACVIVAEGIRPDKGMIEKAKEVGVLVLGTENTAYETCIGLYKESK